jgi:hypothetical protein
MSHNIRSKWVSGNLQFFDEVSGDNILTIDGANKAIDIASIRQNGVAGIEVSSLRDASITATKLANGAGLGALVAAGIGASASYTKASTGANDLAVADAAARACICVVVVTEVFANGTGAQTTFTIGDESSAASIMASSKLTGATLGSVFAFAGQITASEKLVVTAGAATGTGTGAISVTALLLPEA